MVGHTSAVAHIMRHLTFEWMGGTKRNIISFENWMGPNPNRPRDGSCYSRAIRFSGFFFRGPGPDRGCISVGDFLDHHMYIPGSSKKGWIDAPGAPRKHHDLRVSHQHPLEDAGIDPFLGALTLRRSHQSSTFVTCEFANEKKKQHEKQQV